MSGGMSFFLQTRRRALVRTKARTHVAVLAAAVVVVAGAGAALVANGASATPCAGPFDNFSCSGSATPALPAGYLTPPPTADPRAPAQFVFCRSTPPTPS